MARQESNLLAFSTIRHSSCEVLLPATRQSTRCSHCSHHRKSLRAMLNRCDTKTDVSHPSSHTNVRYLSSPQKADRLRRLHTKLHDTKRQVRCLQKKLEEATEHLGTTVDQGMNDDLTTIMRENSTTIAETHPPDSFARLFWEQQLQAASAKDARSMRWHPLMVKWCLYLRHKSSGAYESLRSSGCISLPSQRTLRDYTHYVSARAGFSREVDLQLRELAEIESCPEYEKHVILIMDEMHVKEDLVYDKHTGAFACILLLLGVDL